MGSLKYFLNKPFEERLSDPISVYLLGLLWADGWVYESIGGNLCLGLECLSEDMKTFKPYFDTTGRWNYYNMKYNPLRPTVQGRDHISLHNKKDIAFFVDNDYKVKSLVSPKKVLALIPNELKVYFFRGWVDGDGCFYYGEKLKCRQFVLSGPLEQDWSSFTTLLNTLNIEHRVARINGKKVKHSRVLVTGYAKIKRLGEFLYEGWEQNKIGLRRKHDKYQRIIDSKVLNLR